MDPERKAAIWILAGILAVQGIVVMAGVGACVVYAREIVEGKFKCDPDNRLTGLLVNALAVVIALLKK